MVVFLATSCASRSYAPTPIDSVDFRTRESSQEEDGVRVTAAVPSPEETEAIFGLPLYRKGIQPIWLQIENNSDHRLRFAPVGTDPEYFSPLEVAYVHKSKYSGQGYADMEKALYEKAMDRWIWPGETRSGFVFTHLDPGTKAFNVDLFSASALDHSFTFFMDVPGMRPDHSAVDFESLYAADSVRHLDVDGLHAALDATPCCATDHTGTKPGLPINVVLVGEGPDVLRALLRAGWFERTRAEKHEQLEKEQHWDGRPPDAIFRVRRARKHDRSELRLWRAPMTADGEPVWLGQVSQYIGQNNELARALFDPRIDPDIDDARNFLLQNMWYSQGLEMFAWQATGNTAPADSPLQGFRGTQYFTGGGRAVLWLSGAPVSQLETADLDWDPPAWGSR